MSRVIVAHPNIQHSLQLAVGLQKAGLLAGLITRLYASWHHPPFSYLRWLPRAYRARLEERVFATVRRSHVELAPEKISVVDTNTALIPILLRRAGLISQSNWMRWFDGDSARFQRHAADIATDQADVLVCYDRHAFHTFHQISGSGIKLVLDLSFVHPRTARRALQEEARKYPEFADSLFVPGITDDNFDLCVEEIEMADFVLVGSRYARDSCIENGIKPENVFIIPYGTDIISFRPNTLNSSNIQRPFRFLFVGQIGQRKGIRHLLDAYERLGLIDTELWLCGNVMGIDNILDNLPYGCHYLGYIPNKQLPAIYSQVDAFVFPSILEGFGLVILEAMASSLPIITTNHTGGPDVIEDGKEGFIIPPGDVDALVEAMLYLYDHPTERTEMGKAARQAAEKNSWEDYQQNAARVFKSILSDPMH